MNLFIAESSQGTHRPCMEVIDATLMSFTFKASFSSIANPILDVCQQTFIRVANPKAFKVDGFSNPEETLDMIYDGEILNMIKALHEKESKGYIYLGQDLDAGGQLMASLLYYHLINIGIEDKYILRVPLLQTGYDYLNIGFGEFYENSQVLDILETSRLEQTMMNTGNKTAMGYRNIFALEHIYNRGKEQNPKVKRKSLGVGNATYLTKFALDERN